MLIYQQYSKETGYSSSSTLFGCLSNGKAELQQLADLVAMQCNVPPIAGGLLSSSESKLLGVGVARGSPFQVALLILVLRQKTAVINNTRTAPSLVYSYTPLRKAALPLNA